MHARRTLFALAVAAALAPWVVLAQASPLSSLLVSAGAYALRYEGQFAAVISDEHYDQHAAGRKYRAPLERKIASEMMFLWLPHEKTWMSVRNVLRVDDSAIDTSQERLDRLLSATTPVGIAHLRRMRDESARFNIGTIRRNFNDPMYPLRFLEPDSQPRFRFTANGKDKVNGIEASKIAFEEEAHPTFIQDDGRDRPSKGMFWIAADGAILRTRLEVADRLRGLTASILVDYRSDAALAMLVPSTMHEVYMAATLGDTSGPLGALAERIECEARYSNFRRFETSARIVPDE